MSSRLFNEANEDIGDVQADPVAYFKSVMENGILDGVVSVFFPLYSFTYSDWSDGLVQSFRLLDE